jgi:hypothetical protein
MTEYKVVVAEITSLLWRDVDKAAQSLSTEVAGEIAAGWEPQGGIASVLASTSVYLLQAMIRRR